MSREAYLFFHQGWSDLLNCFALIDYYLQTYSKLYLIFKKEALEMVAFYVQNKPVKLLCFDKPELDKGRCLKTIKLSGRDLLFHGYYDKFRTDNYRFSFKSKYVDQHFVRRFYTIYDIDYMTRVNFFKFTRDHKLEFLFYDKTIINLGIKMVNISNADKKYILYHENVSTNAIVKFEKKSGYEYVNLNGLTSNPFEAIKFLENACELHLADSFWAAFCYLLNAKYQLFENIPIFVYTYNGACIDPFDFTLKPVSLPNWTVVRL